MMLMVDDDDVPCTMYCTNRWELVGYSKKREVEERWSKEDNAQWVGRTWDVNYEITDDGCHESCQIFVRKSVPYFKCKDYSIRGRCSYGLNWIKNIFLIKLYPYDWL